jgi:signal transduction histidine kinase
MMSRTLQQAVLTFYVVLCVGSCFLGIYAMHSTPVFYLDSKPVSENYDFQIKKVESVLLIPTDIWKLPLFTSPSNEKKWWQTQQQLDLAIKGKKSAKIEIMRDGNSPEQVAVSIDMMSFEDVVKKLSVIYIVGFIYLLTAISVFRRHISTAGFLCAFFLASTALYLISVAPVVHRPLFMDYGLLRFLVTLFFISSTGQLAIVHFSIIFPSKKHFLKTYPWFPLVFYGYSFLISVLYLLGIIALATTLPFLIIWILFMLVSFAHSLVSEGDPFMKRQAQNGFFAAALVVIFFILSVVLPWNIEASLIDNFALFSLMLPFALIASMDNHHLYRQRLKSEQESEIEKARIHRELHDTALNDLASISIIVEGAQRYLSNEPERARDRLQLIKEIATETSNQLRNFLWVIDDRKNSWLDVVELLRKTGYDLLNPLNIGFDFHAGPILSQTTSPGPAIKHDIHRIFREAIMNIVKHANAKMVTVTITVKGHMICFEIKDDGCGFDKETIKNTSFGLSNIQRRVDETGGRLIIDSQPGMGTRIIVELPFS